MLCCVASGDLVDSCLFRLLFVAKGRRGASSVCVVTDDRRCVRMHGVCVYVSACACVC
jgi:hypothetical protein